MTRSRRRRRRIWIAAWCSVPTLLLAALWVIGANTSLLAPGRALPESTAAGFAGHQFQLYSASNAIEFENLPEGVDRPPAGGSQRRFGRQLLGAASASGPVERREGYEWHGNFATHFTFVGIAMWLPLLATAPLLLVTARQVYLLRKSSRRGQGGVCVHCGHELTTADSRCPGCGSPPPSSDPISSVFLAAGPTGVPPAARREAPGSVTGFGNPDPPP